MLRFMFMLCVCVMLFVLDGNTPLEAKPTSENENRNMCDKTQSGFPDDASTLPCPKGAIRTKAHIVRRQTFADRSGQQFSLNCFTTCCTSYPASAFT